VTETPVTERPAPYPVRVDARLDPPLSRGLWLVKWLLLLPHYVVLAFLWLAFTVLSVVAFFGILFTGRYPRALFDFNVGVLRWTWRVSYYGYGALGTDRYPPFTLADVPDYPAHLEVPYPERLSRGLVLVKWWLLAIPHYLIVALFVGGGIWLGTTGRYEDGWAFGGLVALLVLVAGVVLLFTGRYPRPVYDFVLGMDRWALRVAAYAALMTDAYPPFRLDLGGPDPGTVPMGPPPAAPTGGTAVPVPAAGPSAALSSPPSRPAGGGWSAGRVVSVVIGAVLLLASTGFLAGGGTLLWADQTQRDGAYLMSPTVTVSTSSYAITSDSFRLEGAGLDWAVDEVLGTARLEVTPRAGGDDLFIGVGRTSAVAGYLHHVAHHRLDGLGPRWGGMGPGMMTRFGGGAPAVPPGEAGVWTATASGPGTQALTWRPSAGNWTVVVMRADGGAGVDADMRAGATLPGAVGIAIVLFAVGGVLLVAGALLIGLAVPRAHVGPPTGGRPAAPGPGPSGEPVLVPADRG
jgi:hypothetical protein